ncbi:SLH domain-containing protein [Heracleum sosnowskyi]|uniref:SLH domain-containing protein n=1 Tax=Heracleum sosnowskyi TaxID=360622 RepID=A0AAD8HH94_9APIA|nr:SLH domain-containing protein [Heracleum sosnowskyi]
MTSMATTWCPSSFQLRLAFTCRKVNPQFVRFPRIHRLDCRFRVFCGDGNATEPVRVENDAWVGENLKSSGDEFSGWFGVNGSDSDESKGKKRSGGIVGAGVAGVILFAGLTFAALSISKRNSKPEEYMLPLETKQELAYDTADINDTAEDQKVERKSPTLDADGSEFRADLQNERDADDVPVAPEGTTLPFVASSSVELEGRLAEDSKINSEFKETFDDSQLNNSLVSNTSSTNLSTDLQEGVPRSNEREDSKISPDLSSSSIAETPIAPLDSNMVVNSELDVGLEDQVSGQEDLETIGLQVESEGLNVVKMVEISAEQVSLENNVPEGGPSASTLVSPLAYPFANDIGFDDMKWSGSFSDSNPGNLSFSAGMPAPSVVFPALQAFPGKVLVPAVVDQVQGQALAALQVLKVIEADAQPGDLCTRREYARWLVSASSALSRNTVSKVYPAMCIENFTELAFDDVTPEDPDFPAIQGLAEAGLIASKLSRRDMRSSSDVEETSLYFCPESPLSRQDLVSWKISLEKRQLPIADKKILQQVSGFIDIDKIDPDACPALVADLSAGEQGIVALAFGYTRLFQPDKPVTKAQAAIALATGEASDIVSEELARIEAESMAENAVAAHSALVDQVERDVNASYEKELLLEREKVDAVEKLAEEARAELQKLRTEREERNVALLKERAAVDSEMEMMSRLRREVEEQLQSLMSDQVEVSYEKERIIKLRKDTEMENQEITRLQHELEVERKALAMARAWAEDEAKRAREQAKVLEEARDRWESRGIKVVVDDDLNDEANAGVSWLNAGTETSVEGTVSRAESLVDKLKALAFDLKGRSKDTIDKVIQKIHALISVLKEWMVKTRGSSVELKDATVSKVAGSLQEFQQSSSEFISNAKEGAKRVAGDCRDGVEKLTQKFKT